MTPATASPFALTPSTTDSLVAKADPALIARLDEARRAPGGSGQEALDRDQEVHRLSARLRTLRRFGLDLCLGRMVAGDGTTVYVGRVGLTDAEGRRLLVDWRSPAAEPFFARSAPRPGARADAGAGEGPGVRPRGAPRPDRFGAGIEGAVDRYVAMTRATQRLVVLTSR